MDLILQIKSVEHRILKNAALVLLASSLGGWAVLEPQVVPMGEETSEPLYYTGGVEVDIPRSNGSSYASFASGAVAGHPRMVLSCAHLNYEDEFGWIGAGTTRWFLQWNQSGKPKTLGATGLTLTGFYRFDGYAALADADARSGDNRPATYAQDYTVHYHVSANTANGFSAPLMENGSAFLLGKSTSRKPLWKNITGYPSGQYDSGDPGEYRLHETPNFTNPARVSFGPYLWINGVTSYGGNSGGPIWGWTNNRWAHFGVVVSSDRSAGLGVTANHALGMGLIFAALTNQFPNSPVWKNEVPVNAIGNIPDASTLTRTFAVTNMLGVLQGVRLDLQIRHARRGDLQITLTSPQNRTVTLTRSLPVSKASPAHLNTNLVVAGFSGQKANGVWKLSIKDAYRTCTGTLDAATLHLTTR